MSTILKFRSRISARKSLEEVFQSLRSMSNHTVPTELDLLADLVHIFRPMVRSKTETITLQPLLTFLQQQEGDRRAFVAYLQRVFAGKSVQGLLTETGILQNRPFRSEIRRRIIAKILPYQPDESTVEFVLNQVFFLESDIEWLKQVPHTELQTLFQLVEVESLFQVPDEGTVSREILESIRLLAQRMSGRALEQEVLKMVPEFKQFESPFEVLERELEVLEQKLLTQRVAFLAPDDPAYQQIVATHKRCENFIDTAFQNSTHFGISMEVNQSLLRIRQQLRRFANLLSYFVCSNPAEVPSKSVEFALKLVKLNCRKNNVRKLLNESTQLLAYEITKHSAETGEHYITNTKSEYRHMLLTAMGGGLVVGFLCIFKVLLGKVEVSDFGHAFLYSMNYALGFIAIYLLGFTLATKQPAMTAATLAKTIELGMKSNAPLDRKHEEFAVLFSRLFRSQFIAFVGNVFVAFPVAFLLVWSIDALFGVNIAAAKSDKLLRELSPVHSPALLHSAIAGVFLFLSGVISGSISNSNKHNRFAFRIQEHPLLKMGLGRSGAQRLAAWMERKWAGVASNFWFGVFMGTTASVGVFLGLNLDIRHITFASGNLALGLFGADFEVSLWQVFWGVFGIGIIGFINFMVSFSLSLGLALRSREVPLTETRNLFVSVWVYFRSFPREFFFPPQKKSIPTSE